jgi:hypothetical protein
MLRSSNNSALARKRNTNGGPNDRVKRIRLDEDGTVASPALSWTEDSDTGLYRVADDVLGIAAGGDVVMELGSNTVTIGADNDNSTAASLLTLRVDGSNKLTLASTSSSVTDVFTCGAGLQLNSSDDAIDITSTGILNIDADKSNGTASSAINLRVDNGTVANIDSSSMNITGNLDVSSLLTSDTIKIGGLGNNVEDVYIDSYTPSTSNLSNIDSVTPGTFRYVRLGQHIFGWGIPSIDATTSAAWSFDFSLPVAVSSSFASGGGSLTRTTNSSNYGFVGVAFGAATNNELVAKAVTNTTSTAAVWALTFHYYIE